LVALSFIPVAAGMHRLGNLAAGHANSLEDGRFFAAPAPVVMHIIAVSVFAILGAFQFAPALRNPPSRWHRRAGWLVLPCGLVVSLTGLWMTQFYPQIATDSALLYSIRLVVGVAMTSFLILAVVFLRKRAFEAHGASMMRAYALGMGAGTQVLTHLPWFVFAGTPGPVARALLMGAGWLINIVIAEAIIRRLPPRQTGRSVPG